jgi:hypothetical protein
MQSEIFTAVHLQTKDESGPVYSFIYSFFYYYASTQKEALKVEASNNIVITRHLENGRATFDCMKF